MRKYLKCGYCLSVFACTKDGKGRVCIDCKDVCEYKGMQEAPKVIPYQGCCDSCLSELLDNYKDIR